MNARRLSHHLVRHRTRIAAALLLTVGVGLFHWRGLRPGYVFLPVDLANSLLPWREAHPPPLQNRLISDPLYQFYPFLAQTVASLRTGQLLLWNPAILSGHPAVGDPLFQTFYPFVTGFGLWLGAARGFGIALAAHVLLAALGMFGLLRAMGVRPPGAVLGAFTYALGGYLVTWFEFPFWTTTLAWLPGILWAYTAAVQRRRWRLIGVAGLLFGLALLAGQYQFALLFSLFWAAYALAWAVAERRARRRAGLAAWWPLAGLLAALGVGALIGSIQLLSFAELLGLSRRVAGSGGEAMPLPQLVTLLLPNFFGNPTLPTDYWGFGNFNEYTLHFGVVALFLGWLSLFARPQYWTTFLLGAIASVLWLAVGGPGAALLATLPVMSQVALHRALFLLPLLVAWLAALTLDRLRLAWPAVLAGWLALLALGWGAAALAWNPRTAQATDSVRADVAAALLLVTLTAAALLVRALRPHLAAWAEWSVAGLAFLNLFWFGHAYNPVGPEQQLFAATPITQQVAARQDGGRVAALQRGKALLFGPNTLPLFGARQPGGYTSLVLAAYHNLVSAADPEIESTWIDRSSNIVLFSHPSERLLDLLNVDLLAAPEELFDPGPQQEVQGGGCSGRSIAVTPGKPLRGEFTVWRTAINRIDAPLVQPPATAGADPAGEITLRLWRDGPTGALAVETTTPLRELGASPWTIYFAPEEQAPGKRYAWEIALSAGSPPLDLCAGADGSAALAVYGTQWGPVELPADNGVRLYRRLAPFARARVVYAVAPAAEAAAELRQALDPAFDARNVAVTAAGNALPLPASPARPATAAQIGEDSNQRVTVTAEAQAPGLLVLADQYYPGWRATVDGAPAPILRVNGVQRGVQLSPGRHTVVFSFAPPTLWLGGLLSLLGLAAAALLIGWPRR